MKKVFWGIGAILLFCSHDMFLKLDNYFLEPNTQATIQLFNGTFEKSENVTEIEENALELFWNYAF